jgi:hypothetical protein
MQVISAAGSSNNHSIFQWWQTNVTGMVLLAEAMQQAVGTLATRMDKQPFRSCLVTLIIYHLIHSCIYLQKLIL